MKKSCRTSSPLKRLFFGSAIASLATISGIVFNTNFPVQAVLETSPKEVVDEVWQIVNHEYVDQNFNQVDWQTVRQELLTRQYSSSDEAYRAIRQALKEIGDPYTRFLPPKDFERLTSQTSGELTGVGLRLEINSKTKALTVVEPLANSPASEANLQPGDEILAIDEKPTTLMSVEQASELIKGEIGTEVTLKVRRSEQEEFTITLSRAQIELPAVAYTLRDEGQMKVGYIQLQEFSSHAAEQMQAAIESLNEEKAEGFVLDLRGNPGGLLFASVDIARMWMESGAIVNTVDRKGGDRKFFANHTALTNLPLVVLVDDYSASASEILAGALKDNGRATVVGTNTYGKGTVQSVHSLSDGSGLAVTISRYYPPSGIDINQKGIAPDIHLTLTQAQKLRLQANPELIGTEYDPQYAQAVSVLRTSGIGQVELPEAVGIR